MYPGLAFLLDKNKAPLLQGAFCLYLPGLTDELDRRAILAVDLDAGECGNADQINSDGSQISSGDRYRLDRLIGRTGTDCLDLDTFVFTDNTCDCTCNRVGD